jgi:hypothetical protein
MLKLENEKGQRVVKGHIEEDVYINLNFVNFVKIWKNCINGNFILLLLILLNHNKQYISIIFITEDSPSAIKIKLSYIQTNLLPKMSKKPNNALQA